MLGKITFYNANSGEGKIITKEEKIYNFTMDSWKDYEHLPAVGVEVEFDVEDDGSIKRAKYSNQKEGQKQKEAQNATKEGTKFVEEESLIQENIPLDKCIKDYFGDVEKIVEFHKDEIDKENELDFENMRRFILTAFHDLYEIDNGVVSQKLNFFKREIVELYDEYSRFKKKVNYPIKYAYERVFLSRQANYQRIEETIENSTSQINMYKSQEKSLRSKIAHHERKLNEFDNKKSAEYLKKEAEVKKLRRAYVDILQAIADLKNKIERFQVLKKRFYSKFFNDFVTSYEPSAIYLEKRLLKIVNTKAYEFDTFMWTKAKSSKTIRRFFKDSGIEGTYSSKTFLKYYLRTLDEKKLTEQNKHLHELLKYLESISKKNILVIKNNIENGKKYKYLLESIDKDLNVEISFNPRETFKSCKLKKPDVIFLDLDIRTTDAFEYIKSFNKECGFIKGNTEFILCVEEINTETFLKARRVGVKNVIVDNLNDEDLMDKFRTIL